MHVKAPGLAPEPKAVPPPESRGICERFSLPIFDHMLLGTLHAWQDNIVNPMLRISLSSWGDKLKDLPDKHSPTVGNQMES